MGITGNHSGERAGFHKKAVGNMCVTAGVFCEREMSDITVQTYSNIALLFQNVKTSGCG